MIEARQVPRPDGRGSMTVNFECYWELKVTCVLGGQIVEERLRADERKELIDPTPVQVDSVWYIRYDLDNNEYIEFMRNTVVKRSLLWMEEEVPPEPRRQVGTQSGWDDANDQERTPNE